MIKKITSVLLTLFSTIWFTGCKETNDRIKNSVIDISSISTDKSIYSAVKDLEIIEVKSDFVFRGIYEILVDGDGNVYIKDFISTLSRGILKIDSSGNEIFRITAKGKGPQEFLCIDAFTIFNNNLIYYDCLKKRFVYHDTNTGQFIKAIPNTQGFINKIAVLKDAYIVVENNQQGESKVCIINAIDLTSGKTILKENDNFKNFYGTSLTNYNSDYIIYKNSLKDTLQVIKDDRIIESIYLNFDNDLITMKRLLNEPMAPEDRIKIYQSGDIEKVTSNLLSFSNIIAFKSIKGDDKFFNLLDLSKKTCERFKLDDKFPFPLFAKNNIFYSLVDGMNLQKLRTEEVLNDLGVYNNTIEEDKTYIVKFHLKK